MISNKLIFLYKIISTIVIGFIYLFIAMTWINSIDGEYDNEGRLLNQMLMFVVSFPSGFLAALIISLCEYIFIFGNKVTVSLVVFDCIIYFLVTWVQWVIIIPHIIWKRKMSRLS